MTAAGTAWLTAFVAYSLLATAGLWAGVYAFHNGRQAEGPLPRRLFRSLAYGSVPIVLYGVYGLADLVAMVSAPVDGFLDLMLLLFMLLLASSVRALHQHTALALSGPIDPESRLYTFVEVAFGGAVLLEAVAVVALEAPGTTRLLMVGTGGLLVVYGLQCGRLSGTVASVRGTTLDAFRRLVLVVLGIAGTIALGHGLPLLGLEPAVVTTIDTVGHVLIAAFLFVLVLRLRQVM